MKRFIGAVAAAMLLGTALATSVADVKKKGVLVLGTDPQFAPFEFTNDKGEIQGFEIDLAQAIAKDLGVRLEIRSVGFGALMPGAVTSGRVDMAMSGITITDERSKIVSFSSPLYRSAQVFIVRKGNPRKFSWPAKTLAGRNIGVQANTTGQYEADQRLKPLKANIKVYNNFASALADLRAGRIDTVIGDAPTVDYLAKAQPGQFEKAGQNLASEDYGVAVKKNSDLVGAINATLERLRKNGEYQKLLEKWIVQK
ncbi:polar amino acid transport system substrate-binding protein [Deinobacterium chartae]|uniref:Polar amino acid transport system substrate-binding protein n=1 Tax=Deinobacterium chartae TaxID=521158 RepID=A0A841I196_9DEIO|nr:ABC transporter substrate-binding protein [Deinobacterium chartae]MBB6098764.1 polar amino acid transport system substrate-binding protein [Deinobacterium chartae]